MSSLVIKGGRVIDPANNVDEVRDVFVVDGKITAAAAKDAEVIEAAGKIVTPGLIDMHVHLREPGRSDKETFATGTLCAARGGFTSVVCMPNTTPPADNAGTIAFMKQRAAEAACVNVFPTGAITRELKGEELAPIGSLKKAGVVAITDDGHCVQNNELMRRAVEYAKMFDLPVLDHCQDYNLVADGMMNEGHWSAALGLRGWPSIGEDVIVARNILIAEQVDWHIHCLHISSARSVELIRQAKKRGIKITGEACPHHFTLTEESVKTYDTNYKMNPPLRTERDREALWAGLADGTLEIIGSDHAPHCTYEKEVEFDVAPFGIIGLETELALSLELVRKKVLSLRTLVETFTVNPARLLRLKEGTLSIGADANITVIDPEREWTYDVTQSASKSRNSPFHGWKFRGQALATIVKGNVVWHEFKKQSK
ncbi:MAG TPA: dihydroorotase [Verrucomicrobiae bacterium]|nr:dihydroorotase [Verrucomicrobiae bacterium]